MGGEAEFFLNAELASELRAAVQSANLYRFDEKVKSEYSMICAVADRIQDADQWLNEHSELPINDVDALTWLMLASVVKSSVESLCKKFGVQYHDNDAKRPENHVYFGAVCNYYRLCYQDGTILTDDDLFQYFRALTFSHPYGTRKGKDTDKKHTNYPFLDQDETVYAPYMVLEKDPFTDCFKGMPVVGVHVYSNKHDDIKSLFVPFDSLKDYLYSRHDRIKKVCGTLRDRVKKAEERFRAERIDRTASSIEQFRMIREKLVSRACETYFIDRAIDFVECPSSCSGNNQTIEEYRRQILELAPVLCDEIEKLNYEDFTRRLEHVTGCHWHSLPSGVSYSTKKVFEYFNGRNSTKREWGRQDLKLLSEDYVGKWVKIDFDMPDLEIRMLVTLAYYMEYGRYRKCELYEEEVARKKIGLSRKMVIIKDDEGSFAGVQLDKDGQRELEGNG